MATEKLSITVDAEIADRVRQLAGRRGVSAFVGTALAHEVARADLRSLLDDLEAELGPPDPAMVVEAGELLSDLERRAREVSQRRAG
ncbi:MAG: hypothetical protein ACRDZ5_07460 [Acidimicrobiales bacterium]